MPRQTIIDTPQFKVHVGWSKGKEATLEVETDEDIISASKVLSPQDLDDLEAIIRRVKRQVFEVSPLDLLLDSKNMTSMAQNLSNFWESTPDGVTGKIKRVSCTYPTAADPDVPDFSAPYVYMREKIMVGPQTMVWARKAQRQSDGTLPKLESQNLERSYIAELSALTDRQDNLVEYLLREALFGKFTYEVGTGLYDQPVIIHQDYQFKYNFMAQLPWADSSFSVMKKDISSVVTIFENINGIKPTHAYCDVHTLKSLLNWDTSVVGELNVPNSEAHIVKLPDAQIRSNEPVEFMDMTWIPLELPAYGDWPELQGVKGKVAFVNWDGQPLHLIEGPSSDTEAPMDHTGKFSKGWVEKDPHSAWILSEYSFMPVWADLDKVMILEVGER